MNLYCQICCRNFTIKKIYYDINSPYIEYRCHCFSQFKKLGLSNFVLNNFCNNSNKNISRNNYYRDCCGEFCNIYLWKRDI